MRKYETVFFDADNTLFDFDRSQKVAFHNAFTIYGLNWSEEILAQYEEINLGYWVLMEQGGITKKELVKKRFSDLFAMLGLSVDPAAFNQVYLNELGKSALLIPEAEMVCRKLSRDHRLVIATNGVSHVQRNRLALSPISPYIFEMIVSEEAGAEKPDEKFFTFAFQKCGIKAGKDILMVGDSLFADIQGGNLAGIRTCWYNPACVPASLGIHPDYTIRSLAEVLAIVDDE